MFGLLRFIRSLCGLASALQVIHIIEAIMWLLESETASVDIGAFFALVLVKTIVLAITGVLFFWLREVINRLHIKKHGTAHPSLAEKTWSL